MISRQCVLSLTVVLTALLAGRAQTSPSHGPPKEDYSQEAAVIEQMVTKIAFDNDGKFSREQTSRVRVQTDTGVKEWGLLSFPFQSATQTVEIDYVRVRKADGTTLITPPDNVQDLDSEITRSAPFYSDLREKHVAVKGLGKGDTLEYQAHWHTTKPLIPGQFWFQYGFQHEGIVLDERMEIKVPAERSVKVRGPQATQTVATEAGFRVYTWTYSKLQSATEPGSDQKKQTESERGLLPPSDVEISSFTSWEDVGRWYWNLQKDRIEPTPAIRAKAAELTKGMTDDAAKLRALYSFVSTQYRYIGIAFGIGRYQPHAADDVLTNNYGDCKDKHTLLASLLQASGITLYPALISSSFKLDRDVPSPAQFDHVIGYLPQGKGKDAVWLDTTLEIAPFGYLVPRLRDKPALVMSADNSIQLVTTPADPSSTSTQTFRIDGKLSDDGTFEARVEDTIRGDVEVAMRAAFRQVPQPQWKDLMQQISYGLGYAGTVSDVNASMPEAIGEPFHFSYSYNRKDYPDWSNRQFTVPGLPFYMPPVRDDAKYPIWLGSSLETVSDSKVELPKGHTPLLPSNVDLKYDFAEYHASYSRDKDALIAKRRIVIKMREVPVAEFDDYRSFVKNLQNDVNQYVQTSFSSVPDISTASVQGRFPQFLREIQDLPESDSHDANRLESDARDDLKKLDTRGAVGSLHSAVAADPKFARAWVLLGALLLEGKQYSQASAAFESAAKIKGDHPYLQASLGSAYLLAGEREKAAAAFTKLAESDQKGDTFNDVAYQMANADLKLPLALDFATKAVHAAEEESQQITLADLKTEDLRKIVKVAVYWDTLGWVDERMSNLEEAEQYLQASWKLTQDGVVASHLCHLYERVHKVGLAIQMCRLALDRMPVSQQLALDQVKTEVSEAQKRLDRLTGGTAKSTTAGEVSEVIIRERRFKLPRFLPGTESAEFFVLLASDGKSKAFKVEDVKFISGSDKMKLQGKQLKTIDFDVPAPDNVPTRFVRRGILGCYQYSGCSFALLDPASVQSLN